MTKSSSESSTVSELSKVSKEKAETKEVIKEESVSELSEAQRILKEYGGLESNIPLNSPYWRLRS